MASTLGRTGAGEPPARLAPGEPSDTEIYGLSLAALATAVLTLWVESRSPATVALLALALVPWALLAGGVRLPLWAFIPAALLPPAVIIVTEEAGAPIFFGVFTVAWVMSVTDSRVYRLVALVASGALPFLCDAVTEGGAMDAGLPYFLAGIVTGALAGLQFRHQRQLAAQLAWSENRLDAAAVAEERRRLAREVHDVVAHSLTVVMVNVAGARKALATHPELAAEALDRAERVGRESLDGIRQIVGLLRDDETLCGAAPTPIAADVPSIVDAQRIAGAKVTLDVHGDLAAVGPLPGAALARVVQESLTNAQRHAPGAPIAVEVTASPERLVVEVRNGPARRPPLDQRGSRIGLGLVGMRERVEALGGVFSAAPAEDGGWLVTGEIPLGARSTPSPSPV
jgi:signal transduction histidine kinase